MFNVYITFIYSIIDICLKLLFILIFTYIYKFYLNTLFDIDSKRDKLSKGSVNDIIHTYKYNLCQYLIINNMYIAL